jgi:adenosylcobinamide kinase/adenosylcobinamide-phosphate guanylyltransferase
MVQLRTTTLVIGGAASGKTGFAERLGLEFGTKCLYIATAEAFDDEMHEKIKVHKQERAAANWNTKEAPYKLSEALLSSNQYSFDAILIDCATMWLSNHFLRKSILQDEIKNLIVSIKACKTSLIIVSNELGNGIVPENKLAREFRNLHGKLNQNLAHEADTVVQLIAGIPVEIKGAIKRNTYAN